MPHQQARGSGTLREPPSDAGLVHSPPNKRSKSCYPRDTLTPSTSDQVLYPRGSSHGSQLPNYQRSRNSSRSSQTAPRQRSQGSSNSYQSRRGRLGERHLSTIDSEISSFAQNFLNHRVQSQPAAAHDQTGKQENTWWGRSDSHSRYDRDGGHGLEAPSVDSFKTHRDKKWNQPKQERGGESLEGLMASPKKKSKICLSTLSMFLTQMKTNVMIKC